MKPLLIIAASFLINLAEARQFQAPTSGLEENFDVDCLSKTDPLRNETCLFLKNPTFSARKEFAITSLYFYGPTNFWNTASDGSDYQNENVIIRDLDASGNLQNNFLTVVPGAKGIKRVTALSDGSWRFPYSLCVQGKCMEDANRKYGQVSAYYWANELRHFMQERTGKFYADAHIGKTKTQFVTVYTASNVSNYIPELHQINLALKSYSNAKKQKWKEEDALLAEQIQHEYGHGNFYAATRLKSNYNSKTTNKKHTDRCLSQNGCLLAINEAVAFLQSAMPFDSPKIYETQSGDGEGLINLNTRDIINRKAADAFGRSYPIGNAHDLGIIYASIWWNVRSNRCNNFSLENDDETRKAKIDKLLTEHLLWLGSADTIPTAIGKVAILASQLPGYGKPYADAFLYELTRRYTNRGAVCGLNL